MSVSSISSGVEERRSDSRRSGTEVAPAVNEITGDNLGILEISKVPDWVAGSGN